MEDFSVGLSIGFRMVVRNDHGGNCESHPTNNLLWFIYSTISLVPFVPAQQHWHPISSLLLSHRSHPITTLLMSYYCHHRRLSVFFFYFLFVQCHPLSLTSFFLLFHSRIFFEYHRHLIIFPPNPNGI